jgi:glycerate 2-kinase
MREFIHQAFQAAISAVDPYRAVDRSLDESVLSLPDLERYQIRAIAVGKAAVPMAMALVDRLGAKIDRGVVITKADSWQNARFPPNWRTISAAHPTPDSTSVAAGTAVLELIADCQPNTLIVACISGGASAMLVSPRATIDRSRLARVAAQLDRGRDNPTVTEIIARLKKIDRITLADIIDVNNYLLASSLDITQINTLRPLLDRLKAGGLVDLAQPATVIGLILSDVVGDSITAIASGLTDRPRAHNYLVGNNSIACHAIADFATSRGYRVQIVTTMMAGDARINGEAIARQIAHTPRQTILIYGGETTVKIPNHCDGIGGRNQELALAAAIALGDNPRRAWIATLGTDGIDGPTPAAGAIVAPNTIARARSIGLNPQTYLDRHDSYRFWLQLNALNTIGPTGTNVADIAIAILD